MYQKKKRNQKNSLLLFFNILLGNSFLFILCGRSTAEAPNDEIHDNGKNDEKRNRQQSVHVQIKVAWPVIWIITDGCLSFCGGVSRISRWSSLFNARSHLITRFTDFCGAARVNQKGDAKEEEREAQTCQIDSIHFGKTVCLR